MATKSTLDKYGLFKATADFYTFTPKYAYLSNTFEVQKQIETGNAYMLQKSQLPGQQRSLGQF